MVLQLELSIKPAVKYSFDNYITTEENLQAVSHLHYCIRHPENTYIYIWGHDGVGKSHLLQALIEFASQKNLLAGYFSFSDPELTSMPVSVLDSFENLDLICLDDIQCIAGNEHWEEALFGFYNRIKDANKVLVVASNSSVNALPIELPDLKSRLAWGVSYNIKPLNDDDKQVFLQTKAKERGITLSSDLARYIVSRGQRDIKGLSAMLDKLDCESLRQKRKLTIPFAKEVLGF